MNEIKKTSCLLKQKKMSKNLTDTLACRKAQRVFDACRIMSVKTCKKTMGKSETWPEPELVEATERLTYTQRHKGSLAIHSNRTGRMLWAACLVHLCRALNQDRQAMVIGSDTFCATVYNPREFKRLMDLAEQIVGDADSLEGGIVEPPAAGRGADVLDWQHALAVIHKQQEKMRKEDSWDGHLPHLPEDFRDHPYLDNNKFYKKHLVHTLREVQSAFGVLHSGTSGNSLEATFYRAAAHDGRDVEVAVAQGDLDRLSALIGSADDCFGGCSVAPKGRIRPLVTHPAEERDRQPRFRPLFNTLVIFPDADQMFSQSPERMLALLEMIRREPTCQVHYGMSEFRMEQMALVTSAMESLCLPQPQRYPLVEHAFSLQSNSWVKSTVVRSPAVLSPEERVGVEMRHPGVIGSRPLSVPGRLVMRLPPPLGTLSSPADLFRQTMDRKLLVSVAFPPPVLPGGLETEHIQQPEDAKDGKPKKDAVPSDLESAVQRYMSKGLLSISENEVRCKMDLVAGSLASNIYGKHLVVVHDDPECLLAVADAVNARVRGEKAYPEVPPGMHVWQVGNTPRPERDAPSPFLCLLSTEEDAAAALGGGTPRSLFRECAAIVCTRRVFLSIGLPREMGIYHVYLLPEKVNVTELHRGPRFGGVDVLHVWDYAVPLSSPALMGSPVAVRGPFAPSPKDCRARDKKTATKPFVVMPTAHGFGRQLEYLGAAAERTTAAYGVLEGIAEYERRYFGPRFRAYAESGPSMSGVLELLRKSTASANHADRAARLCEAWRRRSGVSDAQYIRVSTALSAILGSDRFRIYSRARQESECEDLVRKMSAHSLMLYNIKAELQGLESMLQALRTSNHSTGLFPHFRLPSVHVRTGAVSDLLDPAGLHPGGSASVMQVAGVTSAKVALLDRLRLQTMEAQVATWRAFVACQGLRKPPSQRTKIELAVRPVLCPHAMALARSRAVAFQGAANVGERVPLVFGVSRGGLGRLEGGFLPLATAAGAVGLPYLINYFGQKYKKKAETKAKKHKKKKVQFADEDEVIETPSVEAAKGKASTHKKKRSPARKRALRRLRVAPPHASDRLALPSVRTTGGRRRLDRAMNRWVREREAESMSDDATDYESKVRGLPFSFLLSENELSTLIARNATNASNRIKATIKAQDLDIEETVRQLKKFQQDSKKNGGFKKAYNFLANLIGATPYEMPSMKSKAPKKLLEEKKKLDAAIDQLETDIADTKAQLKTGLGAARKRQLQRALDQIQREKKVAQEQRERLVEDIEDYEETVTIKGGAIPAVSSIATAPPSAGSLSFGPVSVASLVPDLRVPEATPASTVKVVLPHDRNASVPPQIIRAWENGMVVLPSGSLLSTGKAVSPAAVSSSRLRVLENVLEMELENEMRKQHKAAVGRVCETLTDPHTLFVSSLVRVSFDCKEDKKHKLKMLGCSYKCNDLEMKDLADVSTTRTYEYGVTGSEKYKSFIWRAGNSPVRLSVLSGL